MKKGSSKRPEPPMRSEYDFSKGVRGEYAQRFREGTNIVVLAPDVAEMFPDSAAVNTAASERVRVHIPVTSLTVAKNCFFRSVLIDQFTGGH